MWFLYLIFGLWLSFNGRKALWVLVTITGFLFGLWFASTVWPQGNSTLTIVEFMVAIIAGVVGAVLARVTGRLAIAGAGFIAGGYGLSALLGLGMFNGTTNWLPFVLGGVIGVVCIAFIFDWAVIGLTAWIGAGLVLSGLNLSGSLAWVVFWGVFILGILVQLREGKPPEKRSEEPPEADE